MPPTLLEAEQGLALMGGKEGPAVEPQKEGRTKGDWSRAQEFVDGLDDLKEDSPAKQGLRCFCSYLVKPLILIAMVYIWIGKQLYKIYKLLPMNLVNMIFGMALCFFGGVYFTAIAAVEAAINLGGAELFNHLKTIWDEGSQVAQASSVDDKVDADGNGVADVDEMSTNQLINHKAMVAMEAVKDPQKLQQALISLMNVYVMVIATLKFQFAKTVAIALGIGNMLSLPVTRVLAPVLCFFMDKKLRHWVPTMIDTAIKLVAICFASYLQAVISAFYSGLRGGRIFACAIFNILTECGCLQRLPDCIVAKPFDPDKSCLDEVIAYPLAAAGFYFQIKHGFGLEWPWNLVLFPLTLVEWFLRFQVYT